MYKFSKFLHGTQLMRGYTVGDHPGGTADVRRVPHWCTEEVCAELERAERRR